MPTETSAVQSEQNPWRNPILWIILAIWGILAILIALSGALSIETAGLPLNLIAVLLGPPVLFLFAQKSLPPVRTWVDQLDLGTVVGMQAWRVIGGTFVFLWLMGQLPAVFAILAGFGDVAVGIGAVFVTLKVAHRNCHWTRSARRLIYFGILDFVVAFTTGLLSRPGYPLHFQGAPSTEIVLLYPVVLVPGFLVPIFMILHIIAWMKLREH